MTPSEHIRAIQASSRYKAALAVLDRDHGRLLDETIELTEIPSPPFKEEAKARAYTRMLRESGLETVHQDAEGNVLAPRKGNGGPVLAIASHLDTVFPETTDVTVRRVGTRLMAPGIADNTRGLATLLAIARAMYEAGIETENEILFTGTVGEEGPGDLRGVKHLFLEGTYRDRIRSFIAVDGSVPNRVVATAVGSRRYRVTFSGPGGHSYAAFGTVNPIFAMGTFLTRFGSMAAGPRSTYSAGLIGGGTSVNAIPLSSWVDIDMRSTEPVDLEAMEKQARDMVVAAAAEENEARSTARGHISASLNLIGNRPAGRTPYDLASSDNALPAAASSSTQLVELALAAITAHGFTPEVDAASTDANIPMSLGIPAIAMSGGVGGAIHSLDEWLETEKCVSLRQVEIVMTTILAAAGMRM